MQCILMTHCADHCDLCINGNILPTVTTCQDLGVLISSDLSSSIPIHIDNIVAKAHQRANAILRCFVFRDSAPLTICIHSVC